MAEKKKTIGFRGTEEYRSNLAQEALNRGVKVQVMLESAVSAYLSGTTQKAASHKSEIPTAEKAYVDLLLFLLRDGNPEIRGAVVSLLESQKAARKAKSA